MERDSIIINFIWSSQWQFLPVWMMQYIVSKFESQTRYEYKLWTKKEISSQVPFKIWLRTASSTTSFDHRGFCEFLNDAITLQFDALFSRFCIFDDHYCGRRKILHPPLVEEKRNFCSQRLFWVKFEFTYKKVVQILRNHSCLKDVTKVQSNRKNKKKL